MIGFQLHAKPQVEIIWKPGHQHISSMYSRVIALVYTVQMFSQDPERGTASQRQEEHVFPVTDSTVLLVSDLNDGILQI